MAESLRSGELNDSSLSESLTAAGTPLVFLVVRLRRQLLGRVGSLSTRFQSIPSRPGTGAGVGKWRRIRVSRTPLEEGGEGREGEG